MRGWLHAKHHGPQAVMKPFAPHPAHRTVGLIRLPGCCGSAQGFAALLSLTALSSGPRSARSLC